MIHKITTILQNNTKVIENYFFMTILQVLNSLFYLIIYPFLIRTLGAESYGLYIFIMSIVSFFISLVTFGFDYPAVKEIAQNSTDHKVKTYIISCVFSAKIYLEIVSLVLFSFLIILVPTLRQNWMIFAICFGNTVVNILFPNWYFQGMQKMKFVTYIQLAFKLLSLPFIFLLITGPEDLWKFALIATITNMGGGFAAAYMIRYIERLRIQLVPFSELKILFKDSLPFFWSTAAQVIKQQSISIMIGTFFKMSDVALYDLAYKIISVPNILFSSINSALFPKIINNYRKNTVKKVLRFEMLAGFIVILTVIILGKWIILLLGGTKMLAAYPIAVVMSFGILTFLLVGGYINFIFVPEKKYYLVTKNQLVAFFVFFVCSALSLIFWKNILSIAIAWTFATLLEILYCNILIKKHKLF